MSDLDKINVSVPQAIGTTLLNDIMLFEIYKKDGSTPNRNRFFNLLLKNYHKIYSKEYQDSLANIQHELDVLTIDDDVKKSLSHSILQNVVLPFIPKMKAKNSVNFPLKPTNDTEGIIYEISAGLQYDTLSQYLCRMFISYCNKSLPERERIIFDSVFTLLDNAIKDKLPVSFSTIWKKEKVFTVMPYKVVKTKEEMFNYLLCGKLNPNTNMIEASTFRINRIHGLSYSAKNIILDEKVINHLDAMEKYGAEFAINDDSESCIQLTKDGVKLFNRIYYGRPSVQRKESSGDKTKFFFNCSKQQLFTYFRRFGSEALVLYPDDLFIKMKDFYSSANSLYINR